MPALLWDYRQLASLPDAAGQEYTANMETRSRVEPMPSFQGAEGGMSQARYAALRVRLFVLVAGITLAIGIIWTLFQPSVYRSSATVLMSAPTAIDVRMTQADVQGVAIQRRILLGGEITRSLAEELGEKYGLDLEPLQLQALLSVDPVPETNLVEMAATGSDGELLPTLVENWIDTYLAVRSADIETRKAQTLQIVQDELDGLGEKLEEARDALEAYRSENEIISVERQENEVLARLDGLNKALNKAIEEEVKTRSYLDTLRAALAEGRQVVPQSEQRGVEAMSRELANLQARMIELNKRYTMDYINKQPNLRAIPQRIDELKAALVKAFSEGTRLELNNAERAYGAASQSVRDLQGRLDEHKQRVAQFNTIYAKHQALAQDLERLEQLNRDTQARMVQVEVRQVEKYPQVSVIDWPGPQAVRLGPNYLLLLGGSLVAALGLGVFSVWLLGFLVPREVQPSYVTLSGVHLYPPEGNPELAYSAQTDPRLAADRAARLTQRENGESDGKGDRSGEDDDGNPAAPSADAPQR